MKLTRLIVPTQLGFGILAVLSWSTCPVHSRQALRYEVQDLGEGTAVAINDSGDVLINLHFRSVVKKKDGRVVRVGPPYGTATAIDNSGDVTGTGDSNGPPMYKGYLWRADGRLTFLEGLVTGLNDERQLLIQQSEGLSYPCPYDPLDTDRITHSFVTPSTSGTRLPEEITNIDRTDSAVDTKAEAINSKGVVVGSARVASCPEHSDEGVKTHAFLYSNGQIKDLYPSSKESAAKSINEQGEVCGVADGKAFFFDGNNSTSLGALGAGEESLAHGINKTGDVVGFSTINPSRFTKQRHAFIYHEGTMTDLNTLIKSGPRGVVIEEAIGINAFGEIAANGTIDGEEHPLLLKPDAIGDNPPKSGSLGGL